MEHVTTLARAAEAIRTAPLPPPARMVMPPQDLRSFDRAARRRLRGEPVVRWARLALFAATVTLSAELIRQMWLVLSVGSLTSVEQVMLALFVLFTWPEAIGIALILGGDNGQLA